jgi:hypothetical protein
MVSLLDLISGMRIVRDLTRVCGISASQLVNETCFNLFFLIEHIIQGFVTYPGSFKLGV